MKRPPVTDEGTAAQRRRIAGSDVRLASALATLADAAAARVSVAGHMERDPWPWLAGACLAGALLGMRR